MKTHEHKTRQTPDYSGSARDVAVVAVTVGMESSQSFARIRIFQGNEPKAFGDELCMSTTV